MAVAEMVMGFADEAPGIVASPDRVTAWMLVAKAGDQFVYATRVRLPVGSKGAAAMRDLSDRGLVRLFQRPIKGGRNNYVAERSSKPLPVAPLPASPVRYEPFVDDEATVIDALLPILRRAARFNRPCPTDAQLAERTGVARGDVQTALDSLERYGTIRVQRVAAPTLRMITIVATGHRTGLVG